jgi:hypothetical protein
MCVGTYAGCTCDGCFWGGRMVRLREFWGATQTKLCTDPWVFCATAQFVVSAARIHRMPRSYYFEQLATLVAPSDNPVHNDHKHLPQHESDRIAALEVNNNDNFYGHHLERAWSMIFDCYALHLSTSCNCNDDGKPEQCHSCQCTDAAGATDLHRSHISVWVDKVTLPAKTWDGML